MSAEASMGKNGMESVIGDLPQRLQRIEDSARLRRAQEERPNPVQDQQQEELKRINRYKDIIGSPLLSAWAKRDDELSTGLAKVEEGLKTVSYLNIYERLQQIRQECWGGQGEIWPILEKFHEGYFHVTKWGNDDMRHGLPTPNIGYNVSSRIVPVFGYELRYNYLNVPHSLRKYLDKETELLYADRPMETSLAIYKDAGFLHVGKMHATEFSGYAWIRRVNANSFDGFWEVSMGDLYQAAKTPEGEENLKKKLPQKTDAGLRVPLSMYSPEEIQLLLDVVLASFTQIYQTSSENRGLLSLVHSTPFEIEQKVKERKLYKPGAEGNFVSEAYLFVANYGGGMFSREYNDPAFADKNRQRFHEHIENECQKLEWFRDFLDTIVKEN